MVNTQVGQLHAHCQRAEQCSSHRTVRVHFRPDTPADICPVSTSDSGWISKFVSGTSLILTEIVWHIQELNLVYVSNLFKFNAHRVEVLDRSEDFLSTEPCPLHQSALGHFDPATVKHN